MATSVGGLQDVSGAENSLELEELAKFAVSEYNNRCGSGDGATAQLSFGKLLSAKTQVVAGMLYHLTIQAHQSDEPKVWLAQVWVKPWEKFKKLKDFKPATDDA